jgi:cytochrome P450 family 9
LCFATHLLATHPDVQCRLQEETDVTLNREGGNLTYEAVHGMKYPDMMVSGMAQKISCFIVLYQNKGLGFADVI